jgi:outer membrane efflux protein
MKRVLSEGGWWCLMVAAVLSGCASRDIRFGEKASTEAECPPALTEIEYPLSEIEPVEDLIGSGAPRTIRNSERHDYWDMSLEDSIHLALRHSKVMRDLGGKVLRAPESVPTAMDPAIQETDPRYGVEAALSAFDAQFSTSLFTEQNDRRLNNRYLGTEGVFTQTFDVFQTEVAKRSVTGSEFSVRHGFDFDRNSNAGNQFQDGAWNTVLEGEFRHSLLQGGGVDFNRIAGPGSTPGVYNGVLVARVKTDVSLADFQIGLRDLVCDVENAYWDLYFAYRDLDTKVRARDASLSTWRRVDALHRSGKKGGELEKEAQAREQYYRFEADAQNALMGRPLEGTRTHNGSRPGTFRPTPGVYSAERRLRLLIGLPPNEELVIRPLDEPPAAPSSFDWYSVASEALGRRPELRRQQWKVKARELELAASRNYLLPDLDIVGRYRWRGFGEDLLDPNRSGTRLDAYSELTSGDFQEWQLGMEMSLPIGFRQGHTAVRNAQFRLSRARCLLLEQKRQVLNDLSGAVSEVDRAYHLLETNINRAHAAEQQMKVLQALYEEAEKVEFFVVLDAQRRYVEALRLYYQSRVEYALALRNVHFERGGLLDYCQLWLAEGSWPQKAYSDAARREHRRGHPKAIDYRIKRPPIIASGYTSMPSIVVPEVPPEQSPPENGPTEALLIPDSPYSPHAERIPGPRPANSQADQPQPLVLTLPPSQRPSRFARDGTGPSRSVNTSRVVPLPPVQVAVRPDEMSSLR